MLAVASRLERAIATTVSPVDAGPEKVTLSLGVAMSDGCSDLDDLLARADAALYQAKREGRGRANLVGRNDSHAML